MFAVTMPHDNSTISFFEILAVHERYTKLAGDKTLGQGFEMTRGAFSRNLCFEIYSSVLRFCSFFKNDIKVQQKNKSFA